MAQVYLDQCLLAADGGELSAEAAADLKCWTADGP